ncbi:MAG: histone [Candidatus Hodarchaeales archaeon]|jgi:histone H3/H4
MLKQTERKKIVRQVRNMAGNFANARVEKLIRSAGAQRVSADAVSRMNEVLTDFGTTIAKYAVEISRHSGRKTVKEDDIKLAASK